MKKSFILSLFFFTLNYSVHAQGKLGSIFQNVREKTQEVKSTVDLVKPVDQKKEVTKDPQPQTQTTSQDTSKKTTSTTTNTTTTTDSPSTTGTTNNLAIGDQGVNNDEKKNNGNQLKNFVKGSKENGTKEKPYTNGTTPTSNLAIGDQGAVEDKNSSTNTKNNSKTTNQGNNSTPPSNNSISPPK